MLAALLLGGAVGDRCLLVSTASAPWAVSPQRGSSIDRLYIVQLQKKILTNMLQNHTEARSAHIEHGRIFWSHTGHASDAGETFPHVAACARNARSRHSGEQYRWPHFSHVAHAKQVLAAATPTRRAVVSPRDFRALVHHGRRPAGGSAGASARALVRRAWRRASAHRPLS